jgi:hypothetical protein
VLCYSISVGGLIPSALAQTVPAQAVPARIDVVVVEGEGVTSSIRQRDSHDPVVRVEDDDHRPVANAPVVFTLPVNGTSGEFPNGSKNLTVMTDQNGLATARGLKLNDIPGKLQIYVTASFHGLRARTLINQVVEAPPGTKAPSPDLRTSKSGGKWKWIVLGIVAAGGAGAGVYFKNRSSSASSVSISTGTVVFGSPR